jgi:gamma-glutamylcyclotransferase
MASASASLLCFDPDPESTKPNQVKTKKKENSPISNYDTSTNTLIEESHTMHLWHYISQTLLAQNQFTTTILPSTTITPSIISPSAMSKASPLDPFIQTMATPHNNNDTTTNTTLYFGYGSNLWRQQMQNRCPNSTYLGIARLDNFKWIINQRGYANVVEVEETARRKENYSTQVWGLVYSLQPSDEASLDRSEGVPDAYTKEILGCDFWPAVNGDQDGSSKPVNVTGDEPEERDMMVYINRNAVTPSKPKEEYVDRMNMGIRDAVAAGVPEEYVKEVMRKFIPEGKGEEE